MYGKIKDHLCTALENLKQAGLYKEERIIESPQQAAIQVKGKEVLKRIPRRKCWNEGLPCASMKNLRDCKMASLHSLLPKEKFCLPDSRFRRRKVIFAMRNFMRKARPATTICWMAD